MAQALLPERKADAFAYIEAQARVPVPLLTAWMVNMWTEFTRRLSPMLFRGRHFDADLEEEMRLHRELREREQIEAGVAW